MIAPHPSPILLFIVLLALGCQAQQTKETPGIQPVFAGEKIVKSEAEWKSELDAETFYIMREQGTERAFSGDLWDNHETGDYLCKACGLKLFESETKFESGTGWPSFYAAADENNVGERIDRSHGMSRVEIICNRCEGHLGHVFNDGPEPTGLRYCVNSASLQFSYREK